MRQIRVLQLLVPAAVAAIALASPAVASAVEWTDQGEAAGYKEPTIELDGDVGFSVYGSSLECPVEGEATLLPEGKGEITSFDFSIDECSGTGYFVACVVEAADVSLPWSMQATESGTLEAGPIYISDFSYALQIETNESCEPEGWEVAGAPDITASDGGEPRFLDALPLGGPILMGPPSCPVCIPQGLEGELTVSPAGKYYIGN